MSSTPPEIFDVTILGAGPAGMYAAYYAGFRKLKTKIIDSLPEVGGQITALYPEKAIYDVGGFPEISGKDLVQNLNAQMMQYNPTVVLAQQAQELTKQPGGEWLIRTDKEEHLSKTVIIASGLGVMNPRKLEEKIRCEPFEGKGLAYVMNQPHQYQDKCVVIVGGGDSAVDWANHLAAIAKKIYVVHRRDAFRAHEESVEKMRSHVHLKAPSQIKEILGEGKVEKVVLMGGPAGEEILDADAVLAFLGFVTSPGPLANWGIDMLNDEILINQRTETNLPGVYAVGDCTTYPGKVKLISVGFAEAAIAVNHVAVFIDPKKRVFPGHSSSQK